VHEGIKIVERLIDHYGNDTRARLLVLCFYTRQRDLWNTLLYKLRVRLNLTYEQIPEVRIVKSLQGGSKEHVLLDITIDKAGRPSDMGKISVHMIRNRAVLTMLLGFTREYNQTVTALTRAEQVLWIVSGDLAGTMNESKQQAGLRTTVDERSRYYIVLNNTLLD